MVNSLNDLHDLLIELEEYTDRYSNAETIEGMNVGNSAMRLYDSIQEAIEYVERLERRLAIDSANVVRIAQGLTPID